MPTTPYYRMARELEIIPERRKTAYPICVADWKYIKEKIGSIKEILNFFGTIGSAAIGAAIGGFIAFLSADFSSDTKKIICITSIIIVFILGLAAFIVGIKQRDLQKERAQDVKRFMDKIEEDFILEE